MDRLKNIPTELRDLPQWVGYRLVPSKTRPGKTDKIPADPHTGENASSTDPATWGTFGAATAAVKAYRLAGVGFVFSEADPYCGIDLDGCIDAAGEIAPWALGYVGRLDTYTERSQSGSGLHAIARAVLPPGGRKKGDVEMYDSGRFFATTGDIYLGLHVISDRQTMIEELHAEVFGVPEPIKPPALSVQPVALADADLIAKAEGARNGSKFAALWAGNTVGYPSQSEADLALASELIFWTGGDLGRADSLFRQSGLYREKWDRRHYSDGKTYGEATLHRALSGMTEFYSGNGHGPSLPVILSTPTADPPNWPDYTPAEPPTLADDALAESLDKTPRPPATPKPDSGAKAKTPLQVLTIRDLLTRTWPEPTWAVPDLLPVGLTVLAGRPKIGKSWLCLQLMQSVATGGVFLGRKVERGPVLYLALEDPPRRLAERAQLQGWEDLDAQAGFVPVGSFRRGDGRQLAEIIRTGGYRLVIVDTLARAFSADKDSGDDMTTALTPIQEAAHAGNCAVVLIHHHNKLGAATTGAADGINDPDPLVNLQGSISIGGMADCVMGMYRQKDKRGVLLTGFGRDVEEYSLSMTFDRVTRCWQAVDATAPKVTDERAVILETLRDLGPSTLTELNKVLETDKGNLYKRLQNMVNLGMLDRDTKGRYSVPEI